MIMLVSIISESNVKRAKEQSLIEQKCMHSVVFDHLINRNVGNI